MSSVKELQRKRACAQKDISRLTLKVRLLLFPFWKTSSYSLSDRAAFSVQSLVYGTRRMKILYRWVDYLLSFFTHTAHDLDCIITTQTRTLQPLLLFPYHPYGVDNRIVLD